MAEIDRGAAPMTGATVAEKAPRHSVGPWTAVNEAHSYCDAANSKWHILGGENELIIGAVISDLAELKTVAKGNARLMAAAPDLLQALQNTLSLLKVFTRETDDVAKSVWDEADAALAKATARECAP